MKIVRVFTTEAGRLKENEDRIRALLKTKIARKQLARLGGTPKTKLVEVARGKGRPIPENHLGVDADLRAAGVVSIYVEGTGDSATVEIYEGNRYSIEQQRAVAQNKIVREKLGMHTIATAYSPGITHDEMQVVSNAHPGLEVVPLLTGWGAPWGMGAVQNTGATAQALLFMVEMGIRALMLGGGVASRAFGAERQKANLPQGAERNFATFTAANLFYWLDKLNSLGIEPIGFYALTPNDQRTLGHGEPSYLGMALRDVPYDELPDVLFIGSPYESSIVSELASQQLGMGAFYVDPTTGRHIYTTTEKEGAIATRAKMVNKLRKMGVRVDESAIELFCNWYYILAKPSFIGDYTPIMDIKTSSGQPFHLIAEPDFFGTTFAVTSAEGDEAEFLKKLSPNLVGVLPEDTNKQQFFRILNRAFYRDGNVMQPRFGFVNLNWPAACDFGNLSMLAAAKLDMARNFGSLSRSNLETWKHVWNMTNHGNIPISSAADVAREVGDTARVIEQTIRVNELLRHEYDPSLVMEGCSFNRHNRELPLLGGDPAFAKIAKELESNVSSDILTVIKRLALRSYKDSFPVQKDNDGTSIYRIGPDFESCNFRNVHFGNVSVVAADTTLEDSTIGCTVDEKTGIVINAKEPVSIAHNAVVTNSVVMRSIIHPTSKESTPDEVIRALKEIKDQGKGEYKIRIGSHNVVLKYVCTALANEVGEQLSTAIQKLADEQETPIALTEQQQATVLRQFGLTQGHVLPINFSRGINRRMTTKEGNSVDPEKVGLFQISIEKDPNLPACFMHGVKQDLEDPDIVVTEPIAVLGKRPIAGGGRQKVFTVPMFANPKEARLVDGLRIKGDGSDEYLENYGLSPDHIRRSRADMATLAPQIAHHVEMAMQQIQLPAQANCHPVTTIRNEVADALRAGVQDKDLDLQDVMLDAIRAQYPGLMAQHVRNIVEHADFVSAGGTAPTVSLPDIAEAITMALENHITSATNQTLASAIIKTVEVLIGNNLQREQDLIIRETIARHPITDLVVTSSERPTINQFSRAVDNIWQRFFLHRVGVTRPTNPDTVIAGVKHALSTPTPETVTKFTIDLRQGPTA
ncbi:hypothetical protein A2291_01475 [candidate division WOR-1 bacterium RIFOXYB2_FULL_42_35]|uniref:Uncharacterized protein n=1 Tax=candidate division WOR-1 bacterium RIFOXYC2_FULL_41_25 TaxID=1802586 RepID=A0A1F4TR59_UNCSA|nr:MAG: hypothetical protein A2247_00795 [candidate division WOR-1 bacterium RIFOXYA2_FULL_41_14]OGC21515.1 MAG: hypothetical protein A2291_01475 [candidate division WOR-1 bacterium RIFOXYB2_FULL_42_35]OGC35020.1 MAG: hypothetical protein A2462_05445 [candidate division WOR-1 bacterium RIFOXYC2_FULL_41_25]